MNQMVQIDATDYKPAFGSFQAHGDFKNSDQFNDSSHLRQWTAKIERRSERTGCYELTGGQQAICAVSCVIEPQQGDTVLCYGQSNMGDQAQVYILAILQRDTGRSARLTVPSCDELTISQSGIQCHAQNALELGCRNHIKLTSVSGNVEVRAQNLIQTLVGSIIESASERVCNASFIQFCASFMTRFHSNQTVMTADSDIKIDAERVNLG